MNDTPGMPSASGALHGLPSSDAASHAASSALPYQPPSTLTNDVWTKVQAWAKELGFSQISVALLEPSANHDDIAQRLKQWLADGKHGDMHYLERHAALRLDPRAMVPNATRALMVRMDYLPTLGQPLTSDVNHETGRDSGSASFTGAIEKTNRGAWQAIEWHRLKQADQATVSLYARGRDYHKVVRQRLQALAERITKEVGPFGHRAFADSAPIMEVELAAQSGLAWRGKHTLALSRTGGSMFFLGALLTDLPLDPTPAVEAHCGQCEACINVCPTQAITAPYQLDARRCIAYLTIEHQGAIPEALRTSIGNRIFGCDDCQLVCPWNKYAQRATIADFDEREPFGATMKVTLLSLWMWSEADFQRRSEGSVLRRMGHERWRRNLAVAIGNALRDPDTSPIDRSALREALLTALPDESPLVAEHVRWALA